MKSTLVMYDLVTLFHRIEKGQIKVPLFERPFVWGKEPILELIKSIYNGFPIGVLIFFESTRKSFETASPSVTKFPDAPDEYPVSYVIDGLQRLSSLYNCFHWKSLDEPSKFNVIFDLDKEEFIHFSKYELPNHYIHLSSIFSAQMFIENQIKLKNSPNSERLLSAATNLHDKFQTYRLAVMEILETDINDAIAIFRSINTSGTSLTEADLLRAKNQIK